MAIEYKAYLQMMLEQKPDHPEKGKLEESLEKTKQIIAQEGNLDWPEMHSRLAEEEKELIGWEFIAMMDPSERINRMVGEDFRRALSSQISKAGDRDRDDFDWRRRARMDPSPRIRALALRRD
jgi:Icc-related predicted phosphoesterase